MPAPFGPRRRHVCVGRLSRTNIANTFNYRYKNCTLYYWLECIHTRETTVEGWALLTVETESNGDSKSPYEGVLLWLVLWALLAGTRDFYSAWSALVGPVQHIFSFQYTISILLSQSPSNLGRKSWWVACLLLICVFFLLYSYHQCGYKVIVQFYTVAHEANYLCIHSRFLTKKGKSYSLRRGNNLSCYTFPSVCNVQDSNKSEFFLCV